MTKTPLPTTYSSTRVGKDHQLWQQSKGAIRRLMFSTHTKDVALITVASLSLLIVLLLIWVGIWWTEPLKTLSEIASVVGVLAGAFIAIIAWAYRTASQRLAVVDSIASNIFSILRISASLFVVQSIIRQYRKKNRGTDVFFISREEYNVIGSINPNDIGFLSQDAIKRINGFYITLRAYRDRALALDKWYEKNTTENGDVKSGQKIEFESIASTLIYYAFLCIENGRIALFELLENHEFRNESIFIALAQDLRAYTFLLEEADDKAIPSYLRHRLKERIRQEPDREKRDFDRQRDPKEDYLFAGYRGGFARLQKYIRDLDDCRYFEDLCRLFGHDMVQLFGSNYVQELRGSGQKPDTYAGARSVTIGRPLPPA